MTWKRYFLSKKSILMFIALVFVISIFSIFIDGKYYVMSFLKWLDSIGGWAAPLFVLVDMLAVVFILPGVILTFGAGFMFGLFKGSLYVVIGTTLGATFAFLIARYLFGEAASRYLLTHSKLKMMDVVLKHGGFKIVLLTRLVPFFPFKLSNYVFGLSNISLRDFILGGLFGIIPITVTNVYIGSLAADLSTLGSHSASRTNVQWLLYGIGFIITIILFAYITHLARKILTNYNSDENIVEQEKMDRH